MAFWSCGGKTPKGDSGLPGPDRVKGLFRLPDYANYETLTIISGFTPVATVLNQPNLQDIQEKASHF